MSHDGKLGLMTGEREAARWLACAQYELHDLLLRCPHLVIGRYVAVTAFDSGPLTLRDEERAQGWQGISGIAYSPRIYSIDQLPHDIHDEWYVFTEPTDIGHLWEGDQFKQWPPPNAVASFVNYGGFHPGSSHFSEIIDLFWEQYERFQPYCYIAGGDLLTFVTSDHDLFQNVKALLSQ